ncbi:MAG TPA: ATP-binding cassette domain-containing protein [Methanocella sp.]|nr:ATP-binding cassette domain-containing protein [Methanocella sp.]
MPVKAERLSMTYPGSTVPALDSVSLEVHDGEIAVLFGANGSGKSTLLRCLSGLAKPTEGTITIDGTPAEQARRRVSLAIQFPERALFEPTIYDDIAFGPRNHRRGTTEQEAIDLLVREAADAAGLPLETLSMHHRSLSYGQRRLAAIASVIATKPGYLFLDEPAAGLDTGALRRITRLVRRLKAGGTTIVIASHDPLAFMDGCDRLIVLKAGQVAVDRPPLDADLVEAGIVSDTLAVARALQRRGWDVPETFSPETLADSIAETIHHEDSG